MEDDAKVLVVSRCQIVAAKAHDVFKSINSMNIGDSKVHDFGSNSAFFCIVSDSIDDLKLHSNEIIELLFENYVFIDICKNSAPFICIGISYDCLVSYIPSMLDLKDNRIDSVLKKIKVELTSAFSLSSHKYLEFHRDYNKSTFKVLLLHAYCLQFVCDFLGYLEVEQNDNKNTRAQSLETKKIKEVLLKVISELYKPSPTVQEMAILSDMSISKFKTLFSNEFGESPHQHILGKRLIMAHELLRTGSYSVSQVSHKVGFNHPSGFTRLFKHKFQCTPSELIFSN